MEFKGFKECFESTPRLFVCKSARCDGFVEEFTVDLSQVVLMSRRSEGLGYYLHLVGTSLTLTEGIGEQVMVAWIAFAGKFDPQKMR